jgi:acetylornithine deacetylase/succinyl-diaminopimelate desuccinylase-like protein
MSRATTIRRVSALIACILISNFNLAKCEKNNFEKILTALKANEDKYIKELLEFVSIPSVSAIPDHQKDILKAADWVRHRLQTAGLQNVKLLENPKGPRPAVYGEYIVDSSFPTALIYGHYDVQPADPVENWSSPPFQPIVKDGAIWGRGASDDKAHLGAIQAVEAMLKIDKTLPLNIKIIIEGEEEVGSPYLEPFLEAHSETLACDFVISADGGQTSETQPSLTLGLRGAAAIEIEITSLNRDVHSGMFGGAVQNPVRALIQLLSTMFDPVTNKILVKGFYEKVREITPEDRDDILAMNFNDDAELVDALGALEALGEEGFSSLERIWLRPTLEIVGIAGGYAGAGIKTVLPAMAVAKLAARLVPDQEPKEILELLEAHIQENHPKACNVTVRELGFKASPFVTDRNSPVNAAAAKILKEITGNEPHYVRGGATIPAMAAFQKYLGAETTTLAFALNTDAVHAPNERYNLTQYSTSRVAYVKFLNELGNEIKQGRLLKKNKTERGTGGGRGGRDSHASAKSDHSEL